MMYLFSYRDQVLGWKRSSSHQYSEGKTQANVAKHGSKQTEVCLEIRRCPKLHKIHRLTGRNQSTVLPRHLTLGIGPLHLRGSQMMRFFGKTPWRPLRASLDSHLALSYQVAQLNSGARFHSELAVVLTPQAQRTVLTRRLSLVPTSCQRVADQI